MSGETNGHPNPLRQGSSNMTPRPQFLATLLVLPFIPFFAIPGIHAFDASAVNNVLKTVQRCRANSNPAMAVTVVKDGAVLLSRGYGVTSLERGAEEVTSSTQFNVASLSKAFTATLLLKVMEEDGRFNLSTKVREIMGDDFELGDHVRTKESTVEDVLSHKMAIPSNNRLRFNNNITRANLKDRLKYLPTPDLFRNIYIYSNLIYGLATRMTEIIGNARWENLVRRHLYTPLGMRKSTFVADMVTLKSASGFVKPYKEYFGQLKPVSPSLPLYWSELAGSGAVVTTADDMARWMNFHLSKGQGPRGRRVMTESTMEELYKARTAMPKSTMGSFRQPDVPVTFSYDIYGMGFRQGYYRGYPILGHGGSSFGYRSLLTLVPSQKLGVFTVMSGGDSNYRTRGTLHAYLMDQALNSVPSWLNASTLCSFPAPWHNISSKTRPPYDAGKKLARKTSAYVGLYKNPAYGTVEVKEWKPARSGSDEGQEENAAPLTLFYGYASWDLIPVSSPDPSGGEAFYGKGRHVTAWVDYSPFVFHTPSAGSDVVMEISAPGLEKRSAPVFKRFGPTSGGGVPPPVYGFGLVWVLVCLVVEVY
ncbi:hypothetical protein ACOMHN_056843 [Nucella lapillus]